MERMYLDTWWGMWWEGDSRNNVKCYDTDLCLKKEVQSCEEQVFSPEGEMRDHKTP